MCSNHNPASRSQRARQVAVPVALLLAFAAYGIYVAIRVAADPKIAFLRPEHGAEWIRFDMPVNLKAWAPGPIVTGYRTRLDVRTVPETAVLNLRVMKRANVLVDDEIVFQTTADLDAWKTRYRVDLRPHLEQGSHELRVMVRNETGPTAMLAYCDALDLRSGEAWEASKDGNTWTPAASAHTYYAAGLSRMFPRADKALLSKLPVLLPVFLLVFAWSLLRERLPAGRALTLSPSVVRWLLLAAWAALAANNIGKLPVHVGFDVKYHMSYVRYVAEHCRIPLANEGWQMFQSPLNYLISAPIYALASRFFSEAGVAAMLRIVPLLCGMAQIEICYRAVRYVYPNRNDLQILGTIFGALLPMNLYISQYVGNEPLAGCLTGIVVVLALRLIHAPPQAHPTRLLLALGVLLGLALLAKVTAVLLAPPLAAVIGYAYFSRRPPRERPLGHAIAALALVFGVAAIICGWYYVRNWIELGRPFIGGWDPARRIAWWQDPGYRTWGQYLGFGEALRYPVYCGVAGVWDGLYATFWLDGFLSGVLKFPARPPWNYGFMLSGAWLGLLPTVALAMGLGTAVHARRPSLHPGLLFAACCILIYWTALFHFTLTNPAYCATKCAYTVGIVSCYALVAVAGFDLLCRYPFTRAALYGGLACWALAAYLAYFIV